MNLDFGHRRKDQRIHSATESVPHQPGQGTKVTVPLNNTQINGNKSDSVYVCVCVYKMSFQDIVYRN